MLYYPAGGQNDLFSQISGLADNLSLYNQNIIPNSLNQIKWAQKKFCQQYWLAQP